MSKSVSIQAPAPLALSSEVMIQQLEQKRQANPNNANIQASLGLAYLQQTRQNGDPALLNMAESAFAAALSHDKNHLDALMGQGMLALVRHDFTGALTWASQAQTINPYRAQVLGIMVDAYVELGQYEAAAETTQQMVDLRPDLTSYSRVSYLRELYGDRAGSIAAMQAAVDTGLPGDESTLWAQTQLGNLYLNGGQLAEAETHYQQILYYQSDHLYALAGLAQIQEAKGNIDQAIAIMSGVVEQLPLAEFVIRLGEFYEISGDPKMAQEQYGLARIIYQLDAANGTDSTLEYALFEVNHGSDSALALALMEAAYQQRPTIYAADGLAWALYRNGQYAAAKKYSQQSLRLATKEASFHHHASLIAQALNDSSAAKMHLDMAKTINPYALYR